MSRGTSVGLVASIVFATAVAAAAQPVPGAGDPRTDWEVAEGFSLDIDTEGHALPSAIAFVPEPGSAPQDPLYFVLELFAGRVKVVTNDRTVHTFAERFISFVPVQALPMEAGENGLAGICLAPDHGFAFVTYIYRDETGVLRNGMTRFESRPRVFSTQPSGSLRLDHIFAGDMSSDSHQIGACRVMGESLLVTVGDGRQPAQTQNLDSTLGKILRMTLDGRPDARNPYYSPGAVGPRAYVWAYGFRNIFSLSVVDGRVFAAENGSGIDRFVELQEGRNYLYSGRDWTIGMNGAMVWFPSVSPVQMDFVPDGTPFLRPESTGQFYVALAGLAARTGPGLVGDKSIVRLNYDFRQRMLREPPEQVVRYRGSGYGAIAALALGPDGIYFAPLFPTANDTSPVLRLRYSPDHAHSLVIGARPAGAALFNDFGCLGCHVRDERGGVAGPSLEPEILRQRLAEHLSSDAYRERVRVLDSSSEAPFADYVDARRLVAEATGTEQLRRWVTYRLIQPRFDDPQATMPVLGLNELQARSLAEFLIPEPTVSEQPPPTGVPAWFKRQFDARIGEARYRYVVIAFLAGMLVAAVAGRLRRR